MSVQVENLEKNMAKLTITVSADKFEKAMAIILSVPLISTKAKRWRMWKRIFRIR